LANPRGAHRPTLLTYGIWTPLASDDRHHAAKDVHHGFIRVIDELARVHEHAVLEARLELNMPLPLI